MLSHCDGCDDNQEGVATFLVRVEAPRIDGHGYPQQAGWHLTRYCPDCVAEARAGEIAEIVEVLAVGPAQEFDVDDGDYIAERVAERDDIPPSPFD